MVKLAVCLHILCTAVKQVLEKKEVRVPRMISYDTVEGAHNLLRTMSKQKILIMDVSVYKLTIDTFVYTNDLTT